MLQTYVAARELERRRAEQRAEFARQLPLYVDDRMPFIEDDADVSDDLPEWATNY